MTYKTLLVHLDNSRHCAKRAAFALELAQRFDAHLIGLYAAGNNPFELLYRPDKAPFAEDQRQHAVRRDEAKHAFLAAAERAGRSVEWRAPVGPISEVAPLHARHADLLVLGQPDPDDRAADAAPYHFAADMLMASGRPAIVLPRAAVLAHCGENVLIGWDGSREASRAVTDALPLLIHARFVTVETVRPGKRHELEATPAGIDVSAYLAHHGIRASFSTTPCDAGGVGVTLLNRASDLHADLLVAGAYGHARIYERVLGGATHTMLETMTVPVLMSH
ncbi:universal stress protein [Burkholderia sp. TSV86]|uniref:universal stress protein n=1 Tax=Burkholderia sp. TSV86 TaxID=1385594 RepID=UPI0007528E26|nr:universal stress protein [Burkholderia sp. TSV86]KVE38153.1 universal stress protein UspA [Burkholderia sp. TSV86]